MKLSRLIKVLALIMVLFSGNAFAQEKDHASVDENAAIAGGAAATATVVGMGAAASTVSGATIVSAIAAAGAGTMAVGIVVITAAPIAIGASAYAAYKWFESDD